MRRGCAEAHTEKGHVKLQAERIDGATGSGLSTTTQNRGRSKGGFFPRKFRRAVTLLTF